MRRRLAVFGVGLAILAILSVVVLWQAVVRVPFDTAALTSGELSAVVFDRAGNPLKSYLGTDERRRIPADVDKISPWIVKATTATEDKRFFNHPGVDVIAVFRALFSNVGRGRVVSGASTISMQVAGLNDPPGRTLGTKLRQAFRALQLERKLSKKEILEIYLTHAPYGGNICGVEAAARRYFNKGASEVSLSEAALLVGLPQNPSRLRPDRHYDKALRRRDHVLARLADAGEISRQDYARLRKLRPAVGNFNPAVRAPHFADFAHALYRRETSLITTLDPYIQSLAEQAALKQVGLLGQAGVTNAAVVVIENGAGAVRAMVGSADFNSRINDGQVNGALAARSPGSTLKPFIYALSYDLHQICPATVLYDVPLQYIGYQPENFDKSYQGLVRADKALAWSLNVPAVQVLQQTGVNRTLRLMRDCGFSTLKETAGEYGLSLAVGTCGIQLLELTNAYAALARGGEYLPWKVIEHAAVPAGKRVFSSAACRLVSECLADPILREPESVSPEFLGVENIAWKTGTSSGYRDAWTIAYNRRYTVGVWLGNFNGKSSTALVGGKAAAPVALGLLKALGGGTEPLFPREAGTAPGRITVCLDSGLPANADCPTTTVASAVGDSEKSGIPRCTVHRLVRIDDSTGEVLCTRCLGGRSHNMKVYAFRPSAVSQWLRGKDIEPPIPRHFQDCITMSAAAAPRITSLQDGDNYIIIRELSPESQRLPLEASAAASAEKLFWFLNDELVQTAAVGVPVHIAPDLGLNTVRCVDDLGRADAVTFTVVAE